MNYRNRPGKSYLRWPAALLGVALVLVAEPARAIDFWHSNTTWAGQGMCAASFTFDSGLEHVQKLQIALTAVDRSGKSRASTVLEVPEFGLSNASRYGEAYWESEVACDEKLALVVTRATATLEGKPVDLLKTNDLQVRNFKPFGITLGRSRKGETK
jgi:hypothetical protein